MIQQIIIATFIIRYRNVCVRIPWVLRNSVTSNNTHTIHFRFEQCIELIPIKTCHYSTTLSFKYF